MKKLIVLTLLGLSAGAMAQTTAGGANNQSSSSATTSAQGNTQAVNFNTNTPADTRATLNQNVNNTGATTSTVDYRGSYTIKNVPSVNGPNLTTSNDTCMGSTSASANGPGVGLSFGTTWTDEHCKRLKMSRELWNKGMKAASLAMDCMDPAALAALEMTGTKCPQSMTADERVTAYGPQASAIGAPAAPPRPVAAAAPMAPVAAAPVAPQPVAAVAPVAPAAPPAPASAPLPLPPAPIAEVTPPAQPVATAQDEPPAAVSMPVASATVTAMDPGEVAAIRAARPAGDVASASMAVRQ
ncbi:hypothetical protein SAMN05518854_102163 [Variovorax sp. YR266]|uniref:hypothetical protein n=1 Tax=Variovorax sp. YR266 TaxID=1884386 RepID=UPI0008993ED2|nr:hypothetical protein [Variovorax sp. YR266]SDY64538.1 hypothetical protein SAMN05518854_102163 [Variovorax sp. YR266]